METELCSLAEIGGGDSLLVLEHAVGTYLLFSKAGEEQMSLFEGWGELHLCFLSACSLPSFRIGI